MAISDGPYRPNVAALIVRPSHFGCQVLLGERSDFYGFLHWPQGGIERGETPQQALFRELQEEIGTASICLHGKLSQLLRYRFPPELCTKFAPWIGQEQHYFVCSLLPGHLPDLKQATCAEFARLTWVPLETAPLHTIWFKKELYESAIAGLKAQFPDIYQ